MTKLEDDPRDPIDWKSGDVKDNLKKTKNRTIFGFKIKF